MGLRHVINLMETPLQGPGMLDLYGFNTAKIIGGGACLVGLVLGVRDGEAAVVAACCAALASLFVEDLKRLGSKAPR